MRVLLSAIICVMTMCSAAFAQDNIVLDKRVVVTRDVDFYGSDLQNLFDTTYEACRNACLSNNSCQAFTFNSRSNACFPKSDVTERQPYEGAVSAEVYPTDPQVLANAAARLNDIGFVGSSSLSQARDQAMDIGWIHAPGPWNVADMIDAAQDRRAQSDIESAMRWTGGAIGKADTSDLWVEYARLNSDLSKSASSNKSKYRNRVLSAAINGYLRAQRPAEQVNALVVMAQALEDRGRGRDMISALRLAENLQPRDDVAAMLDKAIGKYGFRITEHRVDNNAAAPRICAEFSEGLIKAGQDYAPFVKVPNQQLAVEAEGRQICLSGVEHGKRYTVTFREGLPANSGERLIRDVQLSLYIRDRDPAVRFPGRAFVLPRSDTAGLPIETINLNVVDLELLRVSDRNILRTIQDSSFGNPLSYYQIDDFRRDVAEVVWTGTGDVQNTLNRDMTTRLPMGEAISDLKPGVYALVASVPGSDIYDERNATQWFVLSDIGITTLSGTDGLHVFARGLGNTTALTDLKVTLLSRSNRVLGTAQTDSDGQAHFAPGLTRGTGGAAPALVLLEGGDDFAFLPLTDPAFDLSDRGVEGRPPAPQVDVFLTTDRGAYRAGETVYATALARGPLADAISGLPLTAILTRPDGVEYARHASLNDKAGGHVFTLPIGSTAPRGRWTLALKSDLEAAPLAVAKFLVEDFLPERIDFDTVIKAQIVRASDRPNMTVDARYLFGAPGADLPIEGEVTLLARSEIKGFTGYKFGRHDEGFRPRTSYFGDARTNAQGLATVSLELPNVEANGRPLEAFIRTRVSEGSGRPVERTLTHPITADGPMIGIRPEFDDVLAEGSTAAFRLIALNDTLQPTNMSVKWTVNRVKTRYQWYQLYGDWNWEPITTRERVATGTATLGTDPTDISTPVEWGEYEVVVERLDGGYVASSMSFYAGWYAPADVSKTPDTLELSLDQSQYHEGDTAMLRIVPRYAGTAMISVMSNRLITTKAVEVSEGESVIPLEVTKDWGTGAYVTATVIRPMNAEAGHNPARSMGLEYAKIDPGTKALSLALSAPEKMAPNGLLEVKIDVDGISEGETAYVTLAAVDVGILNLTAYQSPDPSTHYFGQRRLGVEIRDLYGRLIDGLNGEMGDIRSGGDASSAARLQSPPPTEELVAYFEGPVAVDADGKATVQFDLPEFNGTVRLMAVAWSESAVGQAERDVLVRNPVVVSASLPRFLAPRDQSRLLLEITHAEGPSGRMGLDVTAEGITLTGDIPSGITLGDQETQRLSVPISALHTGDHTLRVALTTPEGRQLVKILTLPVRANDPEISVTQRVVLDAGDTFTLDDNLFSDFQRGTGSAVVSSGALARFDAPGLLQTLDRYPYGCTEQITSKALPLLYFDDVANALGLASRDTVQERVDQAIVRVLTRQASNGAFGLWRAQSGDFWLDSYVSDFLSRARIQGYDVPERAFRQSMDNLRNRVNYAPDFDKGGTDIAYALMVLAREGAASMGDLRYYADVKAKAFSTPLAAAQLGTALAYYGDQTRSDRMFAQAARMMSQRMGDEKDALWRVDYGTNLRDAAGVLSLAVEAGSEVIDRQTLATRISSSRSHLSTQESTWTLLAAKALIDEPSSSGLQINGEELQGPLLRTYEGQSPIAVYNGGADATDLTITSAGIPTYPLTKGGYGYAIDRTYYHMDGTAADLASLRSGDRLVTVLKVSPFQKVGARLMVNDPLPAGLEIDNPNLLSSGDIRELDWLKTTYAEHSEFRSDRFLAAVDWRSDKPFMLAYVVRAVAPGTYHHPAASVEDMYRPQYRANTDVGGVMVTE